jgi:hypothetical protein
VGEMVGSMIVARCCCPPSRCSQQPRILEPLRKSASKVMVSLCSAAHTLADLRASRQRTFKAKQILELDYHLGV